MTARKRKGPDRRKVPVKPPGLVWRVFSAAGRLAIRNPRSLGGSLCLAVAFSFVVANALWYQPGGHPSPFLRTRDPEDPNAIAGYRPARRAEPAEMTTFRIERAGSERPASAPSTVTAPANPLETAHRAAPAPAQPAIMAPASSTPAGEPVLPQQTASIPVTKVVPMQRPSGNLVADDPVAAAIRAAEKQPVPKPPADIPAAARAAKAEKPDADSVQPTKISVSTDVDLVMKIQRGLVNIAYTDVTIDGVAGAQTRAAIRHFQKHYRLEETGEPSEIVLKKLKSIGAL
ncbi:peptidoglycan-binding domain-containing protein [Rhizobium sp. FY34]|uniref:peptidoglycan-binding domain-containing protein n=1 Tax=Rhizobium sp. FY34 TaxID=2562309 RepID=UPI0010C041ED|nr:peptidoglycan-binding domain-containing protein [Rhizobium sp. FY34]